MKSGPPTQRANITASLLALTLASVCVAVGLVYCQRLEKRFVHAVAPEFTNEKLQGIALQKEAFQQPDLLVFYGSSELVKDVPNNASQFFSDYPTGFRVFPVGKPGTTSLAIAQKAAAVGDVIAGQKLAYSISPGWFFTETFDPRYYEGNFSRLQAVEFAFVSPLSRGLKRDIARRMLDYPKTLEGNWTLGVGLECLAGDTNLDRALYSVLWPLGWMESAVGCAQDHVEAAIHILDEDDRLNPNPVRGHRGLNWSEVFKRAAHVANAPAMQAKHNELNRRKLPKASRDNVMVQTIAKAKEWTDLELLMRTFAELGAKPFFLSMPIEDMKLDIYGVSPSTREAYVQRLDKLADRFGYPLVDFREHQTDTDFLVDFSDHLSPEGWLYYNKALDDFYHGRISKL